MTEMRMKGQGQKREVDRSQAGIKCRKALVLRSEASKLELSPTLVTGW